MNLCLPGSLFQIWITSLLSLFFLAAHFYCWPYKLLQDNALKAITEFLVFVSILQALILKNPSIALELVRATVTRQCMIQS